MSWIERSIMHRRGLAGGNAGTHHVLDEARQGAFHHVLGPYAEPVLTIAPGDSVEVETRDAFDGRIRSEADLPSQVLPPPPFVNPQNGPIHVEGARKGDVLAVHIRSLAPRGPQPRGTICTIAGFGGLVATHATAMLHPPLPERVKKVRVDENGVYWSDRITLPYAPFIGTIGVSPELEAISSLVPDYYGGNMDLPDMAPGAIVYFPVHTEGARLFLGDCHAAQGDGELCGVAVEQATTTTVAVDLIRDWPIAWPRLENEHAIAAIGSARPMEDAARIAYRELIAWMAADYGFDESEAYLFLTQAGRLRVGNMVDPKYTLAASVAKTYLA